MIPIRKKCNDSIQKNTVATFAPVCGHDDVLRIIAASPFFELLRIPRQLHKLDVARRYSQSDVRFTIRQSVEECFIASFLLARDVPFRLITRSYLLLIKTAVMCKFECVLMFTSFTCALDYK